jgi:hypothetical protein
MFTNPGLIVTNFGYLYPGAYPASSNVINIVIPIARTFTTLAFTLRSTGGGTNQLTVTITSDGFATPFVLVGAAGATSGVMTNTLSVAAGHTIAVQIQYSGSGATAPSDVIVYFY